MLSVERKNAILEILKRDGRIVAPELSEELGVSIDTIRRDLRDLAAEERLQRVHGGALPISPARNTFTERQRNLTPQKVAIAARAAQMVEKGMVVVIGGGSTNVLVAEHLPQTLRAVVITHSPHVAVALAEHPNIEVILIGGRLFQYTMVTVGAETVEAFERIHADLCLLGVCSVHPEVGISNIHYEETQVQRAMIASAGEVVALASSEKLNTAAPFVAAPLSELNTIITDTGATEEDLAPYRRVGIEVYQV